MEEIFKQLSNPFDKDNFEKIMELYFNSNDKYDFYDKVVSYNKDREKSENNDYVTCDQYIHKELGGHWNLLRYYSDFFSTEHRIYINSPVDVGKKITQKFVDECVKNNLPFELKYAVEENDRNDGVVIGSNTTVYKKHIDILRNIAKENPDLIKLCGTPHLLTANLDGWMGIADENINRFLSYSESRLGIIDEVVRKMIVDNIQIPKTEEIEEYIEEIDLDYKEDLARIENQLKNSKITEEQAIEYKKNHTENYNENKYNFYVEPLEYRQELKKYLFDKKEFKDKMYEEFMNRCDSNCVDSKLPYLYKGSKQELLEYEKNSKNEDELQINELQIENESPIKLINEYLSSDDTKLSTENCVELLRNIQEKFNNNNNELETSKIGEHITLEEKEKACENLKKFVKLAKENDLQKRNKLLNRKDKHNRFHRDFSLNKTISTLENQINNDKQRSPLEQKDEELTKLKQEERKLDKKIKELEQNRTNKKIENEEMEKE